MWHLPTPYCRGVFICALEPDYCETIWKYAVCLIHGFVLTCPSLHYLSSSQAHLLVEWGSMGQLWILCLQTATCIAYLFNFINVISSRKATVIMNASMAWFSPLISRLNADECAVLLVNSLSASKHLLEPHHTYCMVFSSGYYTGDSMLWVIIAPSKK